MKNMSAADKYTYLRKEFQAFCFEGFEVTQDANEIKIKFEFYLDDVYVFQPEMTLHLNDKAVKLSKPQLDELVFHIGMVELISYWKAACPEKVVIKPFYLNKEQIQFWKKLYFHGLGEFFYTNNIQTNMDQFMNIESVSENYFEKQGYHTTNHFIVPVGGGKDSVLSLELINEFYNYKKDVIPFIMNPRNASLKTAQVAGFNEDDLVTIDRTIDPKLLKLNDEGFLNGHTPFSALLAFTSLLVSAVTAHRYIALSNESSASESSIPGTQINHQYSKSLEFENDFRKYVKNYISEEFEYFSFLRPLTEFQIARIFSDLDQYFDVFKSCNVGSKEDKWCGKCPKCLFTYIILSPFVSPERLQNILGHNLLDDPEHIQNFMELTGQSHQKPFECVGTVDEVNIALALTAKQQDNQKKLPLLLQKFVQTPMYKKYKGSNEPDWVLGEGLGENNLPEELLNMLRHYLVKLYC
ncbi:MAG: hypothetical protein ACOCPM_04190 [Bacteroidales bacterium]